MAADGRPRPPGTAVSHLLAAPCLRGNDVTGGSEMRIAIAGATGRVGHHAVEVLEERGHDVVAISRSRGVDVITGDGLAEALSGVESIIDAATGPSPEQEPATRFFTAAARNLQQAGQQAAAR